MKNFIKTTIVTAILVASHGTYTNQDHINQDSDIQLISDQNSLDQHIAQTDTIDSTQDSMKDQVTSNIAQPPKVAQANSVEPTAKEDIIAVNAQETIADQIKNDILKTSDSNQATNLETVTTENTTKEVTDTLDQQAQDNDQLIQHAIIHTTMSHDQKNTTSEKVTYDLAQACNNSDECTPDAIACTTRTLETQFDLEKGLQPIQKTPDQEHTALLEKTLI